MKRILLPVVLAGLLIPGCTTMKPSVQSSMVMPAEGPVAGIPSEIEYADFWIRNSEKPDQVIMTPEQIEKFNAENPLNGDVIFDVLGMPDEIDGTNIRSYLAGMARTLLDGDYYISENIPLESAERKRIAALMDTSAVPDVIQPKKGMIIRRVQTRKWPTIVLFTTTPGDIEFDTTVGTALDLGHPVALLHTSSDGRWSYVRNEIYSCWVPSSAVAFGSMDVIQELRDKSNPVVAIGHRVSIFGSPDNKAAVADYQMGSYMPLRMAGRDFCRVLYPARGDNNELVAREGFVKRDSSISIGYLPYTLRNVYRQCFVPYGHRYGWAGMYEERDCSRFAMDVFRCFGFRMPRTSSTLLKASQARLDLKDYDRQARLEILGNSPGGITLVGWSGHIMLYLGEVDGTPYVIQATWGMRKPIDTDHDQTYRLARIMVGDLLMGEGSQRGARIDRLSTVTIMGNYRF